MAIDPLVPANEVQRLACVHQLCPVDETPDPILDQIVRLVAANLGVPLALVSIIESQRQWYRAKIGAEVRETPRKDSFCAFAINGDDIFEICDARQDERFSSNPLVAGEPGLRFYAGMPLVTEDGFALGSLCILDFKSRAPLSEEQRAFLRGMAALVLTRLHELRKMNFVDGMSGLFNRRRLEADVAAQANRTTDRLVVVVDLWSAQFYQALVKALGYRLDRELAMSVRARLQELLPPHCQLYKIGATRFGFILQGTPLTQAERLFVRLVEAFEEPLQCGAIPLYPQLGLGALPLAAGAVPPEDWLRSTISAADEGRAAGCGWAYHDPHQDAAQQRAFLLLSSLAEAVRAPDQLRLVYQPRIDLESGRFCSAEALVRWKHPALGEVPPGEFIPLVEQTMLIRPLTLWVLTRAVTQLATWQAEGLSLKVSVNVSTSDLEDTQFTNQLAGLLCEHGVDPRALELELTESALMRNVEAVRAQLDSLRRLGVEMAIDDFGAGYSNWAYLRELPAHAVKLDQSFLRSLGGGVKNQRIVCTLVELARELGYRVVAEGIETEAEYRLMHEWGCHEGQGYLIARPMEVAALSGWLARRADAPLDCAME